MGGEICTDNRFEIIAAYKKKLIEGTNIQASPEEMAVIDNILFRFWQMGWLPPIPHGRLIDADALHKLFEDQWHYLQVLDWNENPTAEAKQSGINWCINTMHDDVPTVIPASKEEVDEAQRDYQAAADYQQYCETYEQTYDPETGAM